MEPASATWQAVPSVARTWPQPLLYPVEHVCSLAQATIDIAPWNAPLDGSIRRAFAPNRALFGVA